MLGRDLLVSGPKYASRPWQGFEGFRLACIPVGIQLQKAAVGPTSGADLASFSPGGVGSDLRDLLRQRQRRDERGRAGLEGLGHVAPRAISGYHPSDGENQ